MEFHVSRQARDRYHFDQSLFSLTGNVIFANFHAVRTFAQKMNTRRDLVRFPEETIKAGQLNALGLIDEILHLVIATYRKQVNPQAMAQALEFLYAGVGEQAVNQTLAQFADAFPPLAVYRGEQTLTDYLEEETEGVPNRQVLLEELLMLWIANKNPAAQPFAELFDDSDLAAGVGYRRIISGLQTFFESQPPFGPERDSLVEMLRSPAIAVPYSLTGQLEYIRERWSDLLGRYLYRLLSSLDLIKEEEKLPFMGPGPTVIPTFDRGAAELEVEAFSPDREWMPRLVLIAKNTYVWLDQLSRQYDRPITRLDQIPDEELADLARRGFSGLWLIGLWERSKASAKIKQLMGNQEAIASAYSLHSYDVAWDLGGEDAYHNLRDRAWQHGIRLASDMVPNHMGIDSSWVVHHPDWFLSLSYPPYPAYSFTGPDLSNDPAVSIRIEDHYFSRSDAAVVFEYQDHRNGQTRFIYHGNDGTTMPWNDTAQLNYLNAAVREAVIQTILGVARRFPIIRFDAAMTLAKKHYQRLWFPEPGGGGAIPSRAENGIPRADFEAAFPVEFWREVVDRVAREAPDTLLLAEAFWLMEGYFVRTLGMHRVYNSAFMNMLRNEENDKYRTLIKNTLEFEPEILKRYVNFMNNPDERTAVDQFGKGDKYFGICVLMATMPGLPMFGHGQFEGYSEKYGMEFRKALWDEHPDGYLLDRHAREISPLLHRRALFAGVDNFLLYDFFTGGGVDENVFAYSNGVGSERALVVVHNRYGSTQGWIRTSAGFLIKGAGGERRMVQRTLAEGLNIQAEPNGFILARDQVSGLEFLFSSQDMKDKGIFLVLNAYEYHVFLDFRAVRDDEWGSYRKLYEYLNGRGVPDVREALRELTLQPVLGPLRELFNPGYINYLSQQRLNSAGQVLPEHLLPEAQGKLGALLRGINDLNELTGDPTPILEQLSIELEASLKLRLIDERFPLPGSTAYHEALANILKRLDDDHFPEWVAWIGFLFLRNIGRLSEDTQPAAVTRSWIDEWQLGKSLHETALGLGLDAPAADRVVARLKLLCATQDTFSQCGKQPLAEMVLAWLADGEVRTFLGVNRYKDILWFNREAFEEWIGWVELLSAFDSLADANASASLFVERLLICQEMRKKLLKASRASGYQVEKLLAGL